MLCQPLAKHPQPVKLTDPVRQATFCGCWLIVPRLLVMLWLLPAWSIAHAVVLEVPLTFDAEYVDRLTRDIVFSNADDLSVWGDDVGCNDLSLANPVVDINDGVLSIISDATAITGFQAGSDCARLFQWQGKIRAIQRIDITDTSGLITFTTVDTELLDENGEPAPFSNKIWEIARQHVYPHFDRQRIDLSAAINEMRELLPLFLPQDAAHPEHGSVSDFTLDRLQVTDQGIRAIVAFQFSLPEASTAADQGEKPVVETYIDESALDDTEMDSFIELWDRWDAFLSFIIKVAARQGLTESQQDQLFEALIEMRYSLVNVLQNQTVTDNSAVRTSFIRTWSQLAPVFRDISLDIPGRESLRFFGFIAAADALNAINDMAAVTGWDITIEGLRRLARLLIDDAAIDPLELDSAPDAELRTLFDFSPNLELPALNVPVPEIPDNNVDDASFNGTSRLPWLQWISNRAFADSPQNQASNAAQDLNNMIPQPENLDDYLSLVHQLLHKVSYGTWQTNPLDSNYHSMFRSLVLATAWQESCWQQYKQYRTQKVTIRSSAGAVGIMQIMPRVWRGFYDPGALANDIEYNAAAGGEILHHYFTHYALRRNEHRHAGGTDNLVRATYAAYNGGPAHLDRYRDTQAAEHLKNIDADFWNKFVIVRNGNELGVRDCYPA